MTMITPAQQGAALDAIRAAAQACRAIQQRLISPETLQKQDRSPVTVADFTSQAVVCAMLAESMPDIPVVAEETSDELRQPSAAPLREVIVPHVSQTLDQDVTEEQMLEWIDRGGASANGRFWTLDPVDGTKGFLRNEQYVVALALIEEGEVVFGAMACPGLTRGTSEGLLVWAYRGQGARMCNLWNPCSGKAIRVNNADDPALLRFCESVESSHSRQDHAATIAQKIGITAPPLRMDSQAKYATVARGDAAVYMRLPTRADYQEKIWDHAAGALVVQEAGGTVTDIDGKPLDFTLGRTLSANRGVLATNGTFHQRVLQAIADTLSS